MAKGPFKEGDRVLIISGGGWGTVRSAKESVVTKVYKTGNFRIADDDRQWRQDGSCVGQNGGFMTSGRDRLTLYGDALVAEIAEERARARKRRDVQKLGDYLARAEMKTALAVHDLIPDEVWAMIGAKHD